METTLIQRIIELSFIKEKSHRSFAIAIGFNYKTLNNYIIGVRTTIDSLLVQRVISTYEDISAEWLIIGKGEMLKSEFSSPVNSFIQSGSVISLSEYNEAMERKNEQIGELKLKTGQLQQEIKTLKQDKKIAREKVDVLDVAENLKPTGTVGR